MTKLLSSFRFAFAGIRWGLEERNMRIHTVAAFVVFILGFLLRISLNEWVAVLLAVGLVISAELFNSAIESVCDALTAEEPSFYKHMGRPKDMAAGAVLVTAVVAFLVGLGVFIPHFIALLNTK